LVYNLDRPKAPRTGTTAPPEGRTTSFTPDEARGEGRVRRGKGNIFTKKSKVAPAPPPRDPFAGINTAERRKRLGEIYEKMYKLMEALNEKVVRDPNRVVDIRIYVQIRRQLERLDVLDIPINTISLNTNKEAYDTLLALMEAIADYWKRISVVELDDDEEESSSDDDDDGGDGGDDDMGRRVRNTLMKGVPEDDEYPEARNFEAFANASATPAGAGRRR
jgi:hypothetical protein